MSGWTIYWITRLGEAKALLIAAASVGLILPFFFFMFSDLFSLNLTKYAKPSLILSAVFAVAAALLPTTKEMVAIYVLPKIANSETAAELGDEAMDLVREWIKELKPGEDQ